MRLTEGTPDAVHVSKYLKGSLENWWVLVDDYCLNLQSLQKLSTTLINIC